MTGEITMPAISVIVPVFNVEKYLNRCIDSILTQTFTDYELILVDDGSTDKSLSICNEYANTDNRVTVFHQDNHGAAATRNFGVQQSCGEFIIFIDSDDFVAPEYLERLYIACVDYSADVSLIHFDGGATEANAIPEYLEDILVLTNREAINRYGKKCGPNYRSAVSKLVKRAIVINNPFPESRIWAEDTACVYKWYWEAEKIVEVFGTMYFYCSTSESVSNSKFDSRYLGELDTFEEMLDFYSKNHFDQLEKSFVDRYLYTAEMYYSRAMSANNTKLANEFLRRTRMIIKRYKSKYLITMRRKTDLYDFAYPRRTHLYRIVKRLFNF